MNNNPLEQYINVSEYVESSPELLIERRKDGEKYSGMKIKLTLYYSSDISSVPEEKDKDYSYSGYRDIQRHLGVAHFYVNQENVTGNYEIDDEKHTQDGILGISLNFTLYRDEANIYRCSRNARQDACIGNCRNKWMVTG